MPSIYGFAVYDAYTNTVENNKGFDKEQKLFWKSDYQKKKDGPMRVISSFDHSIYLELALTALEEHGIEKRSILAVPLEKAAEKPKLLDSIHRSDGTSLIDIGAACATALTVIASSIGFILHWGPIIWGLIGAAAGFIIGVLVDWLLKRQKSNQRKSQVIKGKSTEVIVVIDCEAHQMEAVEATLWKHMAFGVAKLQ